VCTLQVCLFSWVDGEMTTVTDEAISSSSTVILYMSPSLHHLSHVSEEQDVSNADDISRQSSVEPVSCGALPASSKPLQSYVVSPVMSAVQDVMQPADAVVSAATNRQLEPATECVADVIRHYPDYSNGSSLVQSGLSTEPAASAGSVHVEHVGQQPKVSNVFLGHITALARRDLLLQME